MLLSARKVTFKVILFYEDPNPAIFKQYNLTPCNI